MSHYYNHLSHARNGRSGKRKVSFDVFYYFDFDSLSVNYTHSSNILLLQYLSNDNSNDANDTNNVRFRRQQRNDLTGMPLYPIQLRNDQHAALNQTQHFSQPHQMQTDSYSTYLNEVNPGVSNRNDVISRRRSIRVDNNGYSITKVSISFPNIALKITCSFPDLPQI